MSSVRASTGRPSAAIDGGTPEMLLAVCTFKVPGADQVIFDTDTGGTPYGLCIQRNNFDNLRMGAPLVAANNFLGEAVDNVDLSTGDLVTYMVVVSQPGGTGTTTVRRTLQRANGTLLDHTADFGAGPAIDAGVFSVGGATNGTNLLTSGEIHHVGVWTWATVAGAPSGAVIDIGDADTRALLVTAGASGSGGNLVVEPATAEAVFGTPKIRLIGANWNDSPASANRGSVAIELEVGQNDWTATEIAGAGDLGPITISGEGLIEGLEAGAATIEISGTTDQDGVYPVTITDDGSIIPLQTEPYTSGSKTLGGTMVAEPAALLYDPDSGPPIRRFEMYRQGILVESDEDRTIVQSDLDLGIVVREHVLTGLESLSADHAAITPAPYAEVMVTPGASTLLASPAAIHAGTPTTALVFASFVFPSSGTSHQFMRGTGDANDAVAANCGPQIQTANSGLNLRVYSMTRANRYATISDVTPGSRVHVLAFADLGSDRTELWVYHETAVLSAAWRDYSLSAIGSEIAIGQTFLSARADTSQPWNAGHYRAAWWADPANDPDPSRSLERDRFVDGSGLVGPTISQGVYGTPAFDFYGAAAVWSAGTHQGSLGSFTRTGGAYA